MSRLTSLQGSFRAHVVAAPGWSTRVSTSSCAVSLGGPYGLTVGDLAHVDVYVPGDQIEEASIVLLATEVDEVDDRFDDDRPPPASRIRPSGRIVAALILFVLIAGPVAQVLRWY